MRRPAVVAVCCASLGLGVVGCGGSEEEGSGGGSPAKASGDADAFVRTFDRACGPIAKALVRIEGLDVDLSAAVGGIAYREAIAPLVAAMPELYVAADQGITKITTARPPEQWAAYHARIARIRQTIHEAAVDARDSYDDLTIADAYGTITDAFVAIGLGRPSPSQKASAAPADLLAAAPACKRLSGLSAIRPG